MACITFFGVVFPFVCFETDCCSVSLWRTFRVKLVYYYLPHRALALATQRRSLVLDSSSALSPARRWSPLQPPRHPVRFLL